VIVLVGGWLVDPADAAAAADAKPDEDTSLEALQAQLSALQGK
jgi:hypothetical protein